MVKYLLALMFLSVLSAEMIAGENPGGKISGYMFGDFYYVAANHDSMLKNQNGFWFRRIYFTYDYDLSEAFSTRFRLEMNSPGDFTTSAALEPYIKDAYLKWKISKTEVIAGISPTPTWEVIESVWGYRSIEKTPLDLQKFGSSRDFGLAVKGKIDNSGVLGYHLMIANGNSNKSETNKGKKVLGAFHLKPNDKILLEVYGDWNNNKGKNDVYTYQGFASYQTPKFRFGIQYAMQTRQVEGVEDVELRLASVFAVVRASEEITLFGRTDRMFDPNPSGNKISYIPFDKTAKSTFLVGGVDYALAKNVHLMPNAELVLYDKNDAGVKPDNDLIPRFTLYYKF